MHQVCRRTGEQSRPGAMCGRHSSSGRELVAKETVTRLVDDLDGGVAHETVTFGLDGYLYEIDLSSKNAKKLRTELAAFVEHGTRVPRGAAAPSKRGGRTRGPAE